MFMKKIFLLLAIVLAFAGCDLEDEGIKIHSELLPIESVTLPTEFKKDSIYELPFTYINPSTCHVFERFYYEKDSNKRTIAVLTTVIEQDNCKGVTVNPLEKFLSFKPTTESSYVFKIWKGKDTNGNDVFEEIEIPVVP